MVDDHSFDQIILALGMIGAFVAAIILWVLIFLALGVKVW